MITPPVVNVVEDDARMLEALNQLLRSDGFDVRGYPSAEALLAEVNYSDAICVLSDVRLPGMDGISLFRHLVRRGSKPAFVMITGHGEISMAVAALKEGAVDFVEKPFDPILLLDSVRNASRLAVATRERKMATADIDARRLTLTPRENEVLALLMEGHLNKVIAGRLNISVRTTEHYRARIMEKMAARSLSQLVKMVLASGGR